MRISRGRTRVTERRLRSPSFKRQVDMHPVISFKTALFDTRKERPNPINPIAGESILNWLRDNVLQPRYRCSEPDCEDWGWYMDVSFDDRTYMIGGIAFDEDCNESDPVIEWLLQFDKSRSLKEKLLGREKIDADDPLVKMVFQSLLDEASFVDVEWG